MKQQDNQKINTNKGFTLLELLVVMSIITMLASVVLSSLSSARNKALYTKAIVEIDGIQNALELYHDRYGDYPPAGNIAIYNTVPKPPSGHDWSDFATTMSQIIPQMPQPGFKSNYAGVNRAQGFFYLKQTAAQPLVWGVYDDNGVEHCVSLRDGYWLYVALPIKLEATVNDGGLDDYAFEKFGGDYTLMPVCP